jgi:predicted Zn-dependent protease
MRFPLIALFLVLIVQAQSTTEKEASLGAYMSKEIRRRATVINSPAIVEYVSHVARKLSPNRPFDITVIQDTAGKTHEPSAIPGDHIFIPTSLMLAAQTDSEFAGMLAHSMAHLISRHFVIQPRGPNAASIPLIFLAGYGDEDNIAVPMQLRAKTHENQLEADRQAVLAMSHAGYDPAALRAYLARNSVASERLTNIDEAIRSLQASEYPQAENDLPRIQAELHRLVGSPRSPEPPTLRRAPSSRR